MSNILDRITDSLKRANLEADVFLVCLSDDATVCRIVPFWECTMTPADLLASSVAEAALLTEFVGAGTATATIIDLRETN